MNFCTKCSSYYTQSGTCNCYATSPGVVPYFPDTTAMPRCVFCGGYHLGAGCPTNTVPYVTCTSINVTHQEMQQDIASGSASYTGNQA